MQHAGIALPRPNGVRINKEIDGCVENRPQRIGWELWIEPVPPFQPRARPNHLIDKRVRRQKAVEMVHESRRRIPTGFALEYNLAKGLPEVAYRVELRLSLRRPHQGAPGCLALREEMGGSQPPQKCVTVRKQFNRAAVDDGPGVEEIEA
jgi:hypothetical protein